MGLQSVKGLLKFGAFFKVFISLHKSIDIITQKTILIMKHSSPFKWFLLTVLLSALPLTATAYDFMVDDLAYNVNSDGESVSVTYATVSSGNYSGLTDADIPSSVTYYGTTYSVTSIGAFAFKDCSSLTNVSIPSSVCSIGYGAFANCNLLTSVIIGDSVTSIGGLAFKNCGLLFSVTIPNSVISIGESVFSGCSGLESVVVESDNVVYDSRNNCNAIIETETNTLITGCKNTTIPNSVASIGNNAFMGSCNLTSVTIPNSVSTIGDLAFEACRSLHEVTIPNSVTSIGFAAFRYCDSLTNVTIGNSVTSIGENAFMGCILLPSITIPKSVASIGKAVFANCCELEFIEVERGNNNYDSRNSCNAIIETATNKLISGCKNTTIPNSVTTIGDEAFRYILTLTSVTIPNSVTSIGFAAFEWCHLTNLTIPNSVISIGRFAFNMCSSLTRIDSYPNPLDVNLETNVFDGVPKSTCELHVLPQYFDAYSEADQWKDFLNIIDDIEEPVSAGDVNGDGKVNVSDVSALINMILGITPMDQTAGDVNGDGRVNVSDVSALINIILGIH